MRIKIQQEITELTENLFFVNLVTFCLRFLSGVPFRWHPSGFGTEGNEVNEGEFHSVNSVISCSTEDGRSRNSMCESDETNQTQASHSAQTCCGSVAPASRSESQSHPGIQSESLSRSPREFFFLSSQAILPARLAASLEKGFP